ncbi:MAG TPA: helix-turn-helix domain-containing protein [Thermomicrobiales bacterium]|nr:helix-turn-helix domain-containing protein [Thermomicrobiales bacterium]
MSKPLRAWRAEQLLSTRRLASEAGTSNKTIVQIENGRQTPTFATIEKITRVLKVDPRDVNEFALALAERSRESIETVPASRTNAPPVVHVLCLSALASFLTVARRLLATERYSVTSMIGVPVMAEQITCLQPDLVIVDLGADPQPIIELIPQLQQTGTTAPFPIVATGRDRRRLEETLSGLGAGVRQRVTLAPFDRDLRELLAMVDALAGVEVGTSAG